MAAHRPTPVVIDLVSSDDETLAPPVPRIRNDRNLRQEHQPVPATPAMDAQGFEGAYWADDFFDAPENFMNTPPPQGRNAAGGQILTIGGEEVFIPDSPEPQARSASQPAPSSSPPLPAPRQGTDAQLAQAVDEEQTFTIDTCLQNILTIFPDVSHEHVISLYRGFDSRDGYEAFSGFSRLENICDKLTSGDYPKQDKGKKRKREDDEQDDRKRWEGPHRDAVPPAAKGSLSAMLKADFPEVPHHTINRLLAQHKHLYQTYIAIANEKDTSIPSKKWRGRLSSRDLADADVIAENSGSADIKDELSAARKRVQEIRIQRAADGVKKRAEEENLRRATEAGETAECCACYDDLPMNRQIHCNGDEVHFICFDCMATFVKAQVGDSKCEVLCPSGCGAGYAHAQLHLLEDKKLLDKLEQLQQEKDIRDAGLDDLEECPFCEYKVIMPPVEEDFEFRCHNPDCEKISCRRCKAISHVPKSCEEHAKDNKLNTRHKIEEAMTAALIRSCAKCKKQFIKEYGCNKMTCPSCGNMQCYVCSESLKDYNHFDQNPGGQSRRAGGAKKCPLYDNVEERHDREVKEAEAAARAQVMEENPDVSAEDLEIKVSDAVTTAARERIRGAGGGGGGVPGGVPPAHGLGAGLLRAVLGRHVDEAGGDEDGEQLSDEDENHVDRALIRAAMRDHQRRGALRRMEAVAMEQMRLLDRDGIGEMQEPQRILGQDVASRREGGARAAGLCDAPRLGLPARLPPLPPLQELQQAAPAAHPAYHTAFVPVQGVIPVYGYPQPQMNVAPQQPQPAANNGADAQGNFQQPRVAALNHLPELRNQVDWLLRAQRDQAQAVWRAQANTQQQPHVGGAARQQPDRLLARMAEQRQRLAALRAQVHAQAQEAQQARTAAQAAQPHPHPHPHPHPPLGGGAAQAPQALRQGEDPFMGNGVWPNNVPYGGYPGAPPNR